MKRRSIFGFLSLSFAVSLAQAKTHFCFVPGIESGSDYSMERVPQELLALHDIPMKTFLFGFKGSVADRASALARELQSELNRDAEFRCHAVGYSMGGLVWRYAAHHRTVWVEGKVQAIENVLDSLTTFATPHAGTPLASLGYSILPSLGTSIFDLSEEGAVRFSNPASKDYSPELLGGRSFSFLSFIRQKADTRKIDEQIGFDLLTKELRRRGVDARNDGVVPVESQRFGRVLAELRLPHGYFVRDEGIQPSLPALYAKLWSYFNGQAPADFSDFQ
jgi:hypothetical protein